MTGWAYNNAPDGWWKAFVRELPARSAKLAVVRAGSPFAAPVWVDLDVAAGVGGADQIVFMTSADTIKGKAFAFGDESVAKPLHLSFRSATGAPRHHQHRDRRSRCHVAPPERARHGPPEEQRFDRHARNSSSAG